MIGNGLRHSAQARLKHHVDKVIDATLERERIVGTIVLVSVEGHCVYCRAAGLADRESNRAVTENTLFRLASVTKTMTSAAAVALIEQGRLRLDSPIVDWIPEFRPKLLDGREPTITVRQLLTHTAGLDYGFHPQSPYASAGISNGLDFPDLSQDEALRRLGRMPLLFEPGTAWNYSLATDVLGVVISRAHGASLPEAIRELVTAPLGMIDTAFAVDDDGRLATPYVDGMPRPVRMQDPHMVPTPAGVVRFSPSRAMSKGSYPSGGAGMIGTARDFLSLLEAIRCGGAPLMGVEGARQLTTNALRDEIAFPELGWGFSFGAAVLCNRQIARTPHDEGTWRWGGVYGNDWFVNPRRALSVISLSNTSFEGDGGAFPLNLRDAIYYSLTSDV